jgi:hypothetical protein
LPDENQRLRRFSDRQVVLLGQINRCKSFIRNKT